MKLYRHTCNGLAPISVAEIRAKFSPTRQTYRTVGDKELEDAILLLPSAKKSVRVYSADGFVPNSYRWPCRIESLLFEAVDGGFVVKLCATGAQRRYGEGALKVVDGRRAA